MRILCAIGFGFVLLTSTSLLQAETPFPYKAAINGSDVYVRSGPGKNYYPTDKLQRGTEVEVYRHDPGGWAAIRPPENSFSWVAGEHLRLGDDDIAEVANDKAVAYVGSRFRDVRDVRQVKLDRGEAVQIVGEKRFTEEGQNIAQTWYKVMPPAGEFRWVYSKLLLKQKDVDAIVSNDASPEAEDFEPTPIDAPTGGLASRDEPTPIDLQPEAVTDEQVALVNHEEAAGAAGEPARLPTNADGEPPVRIAADGDPQVPRASGNLAGNVSPRTVNDLDVELSLIVAEEPDSWDFADLATRANKTLAEAESALKRGRARRVLRQIEHYEKIQGEFFAAAAIREETERRNEDIENSVEPASAEEEVDGQTDGEATDAAAELTPIERFDGVGRLTPVRSKRVGAPPFALTDAQGRVKTFVTPAPGLNLRVHVGKTVGLTGNRGYLPKLKTPHLTAKRVELIDENVTE